MVDCDKIQPDERGFINEENIIITAVMSGDDLRDGLWCNDHNRSGKAECGQRIQDKSAEYVLYGESTGCWFWMPKSYL